MAGTDREPTPEPVVEGQSLFRRVPGWLVLGLILVGLTMAMTFVYGTSALQAAISGIVVGSIYVLGASGLSLIYGIKKFANFAHGDMMTVGAYAAFTVNVLFASNILLGAFFAIVVVALLGVLLELAVFRKLETRGPVAALIASVGISLVLQNVLSVIFLPDIKFLNITIPPDVPIGNSGLGFNLVKGGATLAVSVTLIVFLHLLLRYSTLGKAMRACADDLDLARTSGIRVRNVILWTWGIAGAFAGVAGVLLAIIVNVSPYLGFFVLLFVFAAVIIGGIGSPYGAMLGGLVVGLVQKLSSVLLTDLQARGIVQGGAAYEPAGAFLAMIVVLLVKPEGIMGVSQYRRGPRIFAGLRFRLRRGVLRARL